MIASVCAGLFCSMLQLIALTYERSSSLDDNLHGQTPCLHTFEKLDRILMTTEWEFKFLLD